MPHPWLITRTTLTQVDCGISQAAVVVVSEKGDRIMALEDHGSRLDRLIAAVEAQTNAVGRLVRLLEPKTKRREDAASVRLRRASPEKPIVVTPIVQAAVKRALAKLDR